ncbi:M3 family metallopeptidase [Microbacterium gorillae]|uniref:M3 family metallopeptidase n=1 Tax=Microbacterium gorillae TaxID=1231063 RepID=UPI0005915FAA|nr:M3 family metallopeptidase [Microbacterium gorillae]
MTDVQTPEPISLPADSDGWTRFVTERPDARLAEARRLLAALKDGSARSAAETLEVWNDLSAALASVQSEGSLLSECHPDAAVRDAAEEHYVAGSGMAAELTIDRDLWDVLSALDPAGLNANQTRLLEHSLRDLKLGGVDLDEDGRARAKDLARRDTELSMEFSRNIREGRREMRVTPEQLAGLPQDFLDEHPLDDDGLMTVTTEYPDLMPIREYATNRDTRIAMSELQGDIAWPANDAVLEELLSVRRERALLLGFGDWADVETATRMARSSAGVAAFLNQVDEASAAAAEPEYDQLLARLREDVPDAEAVTTADLAYLLGALKRERYEVDSQEVRSYFLFPNVLGGVLDVTARLLGVAYEPVDVPAWHEDVRSYDVHFGGERIGRIHLDLHPREGKYNHAACFDLATGMAGRELPQGALLCNFSRGTMEHDQVTTFLHEFGHLVHAIVGGHQRFIAQSGIATEWDFVEAPSQMLEEWAWDADVLATFARNAVGEPIPAALVQRMRVADGFGRATLVRRQLGLAQVSYRLHADVPADITAATTELLQASSRVRSLPNNHFACGFGHLTGYGACYYTYQWSLVIARDLLTGFDADLMAPEPAARYRDRVLAPGGTRDAADLIEDFLGRPSGFDAYRGWLSEG